jgi:steroid delta-isomerase-like uncharacterized protein
VTPDAVAKEYFAAFNRRDFETLTNILAPNVVFEHESLGSRIEGRDVLISMLHGILTAFPDLEFSVTQQISTEDEEVMFLRGSGTWRGEFAGIPPTGRHFTACTVDRLRFSGGSISQVSTVCEVLGCFSTMQQLGIAPPEAAQLAEV